MTVKLCNESLLDRQIKFILHGIDIKQIVTNKYNHDFEP